MFIIPPVIVIRVDFAALDNYVAYLREVDSTQRQIDAATQQLEAFSLSLKQSGSRLLQTIANEK